ncbi:MAG: deoxyribonuclease IV, partial [Thermodesulfobacteriota bacterium]|nr:deoxyribonuclease IV [Thermodesulfobacteriota bacterium]
SHKHPLYEASISSLKEEMKRAHLLGIKFVIAHTGKSTSSDKKSATQQIIKALNESLFCVDNGVIILLENTAGQGSEIGNRIEELGEIMDKITIKNRIGLCLDTAHAFQAGYKINEMEGLNMLIEKIDARIGIEKLFVLHLNDSKTPCGSRIDRHWHIGKGEIGVEGFRNIVNHPLLSHLPGIMETPRSGDADDIKNMKTIKSLVC